MKVFLLKKPFTILDRMKAERDIGISIISAFFGLQGIAALLYPFLANIWLRPTLPALFLATSLFLYIFSFFVGCLYLIIAIGLWQLQRWTWVLSLLLLSLEFIFYFIYSDFIRIVVYGVMIAYLYQKRKDFR
jgi:hypothetical protein